MLSDKRRDDREVTPIGAGSMPLSLAPRGGQRCARQPGVAGSVVLAWRRASRHDLPKRDHALQPLPEAEHDTIAAAMRLVVDHAGAGMAAASDEGAGASA
jgi:hypothetical protein